MKLHSVFSKKVLLILCMIIISGMIITNCENESTEEMPKGLVVSKSVAKRVAGSYIVVLKDSGIKSSRTASVVKDLLSTFGLSPEFIYSHAVKGFSVKAPESVIRLLLENELIAYAEEDQTITLDSAQSDATWGIDRVDQAELPLDYTYNYDFTGAGVDVYIIDTGIWMKHNEFEGRAKAGYDAIGIFNTALDWNGHGTHVAATVGGKTWGVAKDVNLIAVKVLNMLGSGTTSGVIAGVDWVTKHHTTSRAVANMSLGGGLSPTLDEAVKNSIADGVVYCIAAGNSSEDALNSSPAHVEEAITVGATESDDSFAVSYSNFGSVVDILAPGTDITSAWTLSKKATKTISGTSMACPHVTGVAALYLEEFPDATTEDVEGLIIDNASCDVLSNVPEETANRLLQSVTR